MGAQVECHVRHASLGFHPGAVGILANLADDVEFTLLESSVATPLEVVRIEGPGWKPILVPGPLIDVDAGRGDYQAHRVSSGRQDSRRSVGGLCVGSTDAIVLGQADMLVDRL